jgi:pyridoxal phosphate enzyme (YggS family)
MATTSLSQLLEELHAHGAKLVAVSKTHGEEAIMGLYRQGQRAFGENWVQELVEKQPKLPADIEWHFIGHLQTNKVKYIASFVHMIHSVDSLKLLQEIDKQAAKHNRVIPCLLECRIAQEETKFGLTLADASAILSDPALAQLKHVQIAGVMGMASFTEDTAQVKKEFEQLKAMFDNLKQSFFTQDDRFCEISMGMSGDYRIALEVGTTLVRIGSLLFGPRE